MLNQILEGKIEVWNLHIQSPQIPNKVKKKMQITDLQS